MYIRTDTFEMIHLPADNSFEVDDLIAPAISILNKKGYRTAFCCSGHENKGYSIAYIQYVFGGITPETLPSGWYWALDGQMEYRYEDPTTIESVMSDLTTWATSLPSAAD